MVSGAGAGGVERIGGAGVAHLIRRARELGRSADPLVRQRLARLYAEERVREWTNLRARWARGSPGALGPASVGKLHQAHLNQEIQLAAVDLLGPAATAWDAGSPGPWGPDRWAASLPFEVRGMLRSRANTIEGGTSEVNRNVVAERALGLPREPDPYEGLPWSQVPRS
jgi:alkylation response protein AidB-like acyl-CoA dehydrogenase